MNDNNSPLLERFPLVEMSTTALCGSTGIILQQIVHWPLNHHKLVTTDSRQGIQHCLALVEDKDKGPFLGRPRYEAMVEIVKNLPGSLALNRGLKYGGKVLPHITIVYYSYYHNKPS
jgi:hypothetical protein